MVDFTGNCGNLTAAVGPYAVDEGRRARSPEAAGRCVLRNLNTGVRIRATVPLTTDGRAAWAGRRAIDGVPGQRRADRHRVPRPRRLGHRQAPTHRLGRRPILTASRSPWSMSPARTSSSEPPTSAAGDESPADLNARPDLLERARAGAGRLRDGHRGDERRHSPPGPPVAPRKPARGARPGHVHAARPPRHRPSPGRCAPPPRSAARHRGRGPVGGGRERALPGRASSASAIPKAWSKRPWTSTRWRLRSGRWAWCAPPGACWPGPPTYRAGRSMSAAGSPAAGTSGGPPGSRLRALVEAPEILVAPGAYDAITARVIERAGFPAVYMTGAGTVNAHLGVPDIALGSLTEFVRERRPHRRQPERPGVLRRGHRLRQRHRCAAGGPGLRAGRRGRGSTSRTRRARSAAGTSTARRSCR